MTTDRNNLSVAIVGLMTVVASLAWLWSQATWVSLWPVVAVAATVLAAAVVWMGLVVGSADDGWWSLAIAAAVTTEAVAESLWFPSFAPLIQAGVWGAAGIAVVVRGRISGLSWRAGLRVGLGAGILAVAGLAVVFGCSLGTPEQATVLEGTGALARFEASTSTDFLVWSVEDFWRGLPVLVTATTLGGAVLGSTSSFGRTLWPHPKERGGRGSR